MQELRAHRYRPLAWIGYRCRCRGQEEEAVTQVVDGQMGKKQSPVPSAGSWTAEPLYVATVPRRSDVCGEPMPTVLLLRRSFLFSLSLPLCPSQTHRGPTSE